MPRRYGPGDGRKYAQQEWCIRQARLAKRQRYKELRAKEAELNRRLTEMRQQKKQKTIEARKRSAKLAAQRLTQIRRVPISAAVLRKWNMGRADAYDILDAQRWTCPICHIPYTQSPVADHDHLTGEFRNFICRACNLALGVLKDNPDAAIRGAEYLKAHTTALPPEGATDTPTE